MRFLSTHHDTAPDSTALDGLLLAKPLSSCDTRATHAHRRNRTPLLYTRKYWKCATLARRAPQDGHHGPPAYLPSLPRAVVANVEILTREGLVDGGIDERDVGVAPRGDHTFARVEPQNSCGIG